MTRCLFLRLSVVLLVSAPTGAIADDYGAESNPTGDPIGGSNGYSRIVTSGDYSVSNAVELTNALALAQAGEVVYVLPDSDIELSSYVNIPIPAGVTLAGNRGDGGAQGPRLRADSVFGAQGAMLFYANAGARVTGVRIQGPDCDIPDIDYDVVPRSWLGALSAAENVEVDNCELSNFHYGGVSTRGTNVTIHHSFIHDVHAYPVVVPNSSPLPTLIEACIIEWVWHTIAGSGGPGTGYEARYNLCYRQTPPESWGGTNHASHGFDMHAYREAPSARVGGDEILIHHNTMFNNGPAYGVRIRGTPRYICKVYNNWFSEADPVMAVNQVAPAGNVWVYNNAYGPSTTVVAIATQCTPRITFNDPLPPVALPVNLTGAVSPDFDVDVYTGLQLTNVTVTFGSQVVYSDTHAPAPGALVIDSSAFSNGSYDFRVTAADQRGVTGQQVVTYVVHNRPEKTVYVPYMWPYRQKVILSADLVDTGVLTDFPVLVAITNDNPVFDSAQADGSDIAFFAGGFQCPHEIEHYDPASTQLWAWARAPLLSATQDTVLHMYYGYTPTTSQQDVTNVWANHYGAVWHLAEVAGSQGFDIYDATANNNHGVTDDVAFDGTGKVDGADHFVYTNGPYAQIAHDASLDIGTNDFTVSFWAYPYSVTNECYYLFSKAEYSANKGYMLRWDGSGEQNMFRAYLGGGSGYWSTPSSGGLDAGQWYHAVLSVDLDGEQVWYINGVKQTPQTGATTADLSQVDSVYIGNGFDGVLDEVRLSHVARSAEWIKACYRNQGRPDQYVSVGPQEDTPVGGAVVTFR